MPDHRFRWIASRLVTTPDAHRIAPPESGVRPFGRAAACFPSSHAEGDDASAAGMVFRKRSGTGGDTRATNDIPAIILLWRLNHNVI
jgi:hypothetical protein